MGILQPYKGKFVSAQSASSYLDIESIYAGCDAVDTESESMTTITNKMSSITSKLDTNNFSVDGSTMLDTSDKCCDDILSVKSSINDATSQIRSACEAAYNNLQSQLNYNAQVQDRNEINKYNRGS